MTRRHAAVLLTTVALAAVAAAGRAEPPDELRAEMRAAGFTEAQVASVAAGGLVTRLRLQREENAAFVVAVARVASPEARLLEDLRNIGRSGWTPSAERTLQTGRFSDPPTVEDLQPLRLDRQDLRDLGRCRVGDCDLQVDRRTMDEGHRIDWRTAAADASATRVLKAMLAERAAAYLREGGQGMAVYDDGPSPESVATGFDYILKNSPSLCGRERAFCDYLLQFPATPAPPQTEQFLFWSKVRVVKPVVSVVHAVIHRGGSDEHPRYDVVLKHVYDSHYFLAYAEFLTVLPEGEPERGFYLVRSVRALINPPHGWLRGILLARIKHGMREQLAEEVAHTRQRLEAAASR